MIGFFVRRVVHSVPVLLAVVVLSFLIIHLAPGDPVRLMLGVHATPQTIATMKHTLGLDKPLAQQLLSYLGNSLRGNFGYSIIKQASVSSIISSRILPSIFLIAYSVVLALAL